jgi:predicted ArsR family transcriptional regulator
MTATRGRILDYLQVRKTATANEISYALGLTAADVRHHLAILISEGAVEVTGKRQGRGRGRPAHIYSSTTQAQRHNLDRLSCALLDEFVAPSEEPDQSYNIERISTRLLGKVNNGGNLTQRLYRSVEKLNELNYQAHWEAHSSAPRLILGHCPYALIIETNPELCQIDAVMLEKLINVPVRQIGKLILDDRGAKHCIFEIGQTITP